MRIPVESSFKKSLFVGACMLAAAAYVSLVSLQYLATHFSEKPDLASLRRAVRLQPGNAEYRYHLGNYLFFAEPFEKAALEPFRAAVTLNPNKARYWMGLAAVYQKMENDKEEEPAVENAI